MKFQDFVDLFDRWLACDKTAYAQDSDERRLIKVMALDLPSWRNDAADWIRGLPEERGQLVPKDRESSFLAELCSRMSLQLNAMVTPALWRSMISESSNDERHFMHRHNADNKFSCPSGSEPLIKYVTFKSYARNLPASSDTLEQRVSDHIKTSSSTFVVSLSANRKPPAPSFVTTAAKAPHKNLPKGVQLESDAAARYVVKMMALPGLKTPEDRRKAGGILAIELPPEVLTREMYRPTALDSISNSVSYFLPGYPAHPRGETWRLVDSLDRNDDSDHSGVHEWVVDLGGHWKCNKPTVVGKFAEAV